MSKKMKIGFDSPVAGYRDVMEYISGVLPPYDSRFLRALKRGRVTKSVFDAALEHRVECENSSYAAKIEIHDHIKLAQTRELNVAEKEIEIINGFLDEVN